MKSLEPQGITIKPADKDLFVLEKVLNLCTRLSEISKLRILKELNIDSSSKGQIISPEQAMELWIADLLLCLPLKDKDQAWLMRVRFKSKIKEFTTELWQKLGCTNENYPGTVPVMFVVLGDRRYISITGSDKIIDLDSTLMEELDSIRLNVLESVIYNLTTMFVRNYNYMTTEQSGHNLPKTI